MIMLMRETNHVWLQHFAWGDLNGNEHFKNGKLIIHGYRILHRGDLNGNEHFIMRDYSFDLLGSKD